MTTPAQPADGVEARTYWMRPEQLEELTRKFHGGAVGLFVADAKSDVYSVPVHVGTLAASKADSAQGDWVLVPRDLLEELADDLESQVTTNGVLPRRIERDLEPVRKARELLAAAPTPQPEGGRGEAVACPCCGAPCTVQHASGDGGHWREYAYSPATPTDAARVRDAWLPIASLGAHEGNVVIADKHRSALMRASWVRILMRAAVEDGETFWATSWLPAPALAAVEGEG